MHSTLPGGKATSLTRGMSVVVKEGVLDPDYGAPIGGWQGRVATIEHYANGIQVMIAWDSQTLRKMSDQLIAKCGKDDLDWSRMRLDDCEVEAAPARDLPEEVEAAVKEIRDSLKWAHLDEQGERIRAVLGYVQADDEWLSFGAWQDYLAQRLEMPFRARVSEVQERGPLQAGDQVEVMALLEAVDLYGLIVELKAGKRTLQFPLCDLEALDQKSANFQLLDDYATWFANQ